LRINIIEKNFEQLPELALVCEAPAVEDSINLDAKGDEIHRLSELRDTAAAQSNLMDSKTPESEGAQVSLISVQVA
jgi:hypothetical protein